MSFSFDSILPWPLANPANAGVQTAPEPADEVVKLFEELRGRLLHYLLAIGLTPHDSEEVIQDTFLSLFQHLRRERSRQNLRGWIFRVARNLALKRRAAEQLRLRRIVEVDATFAEQYACLELNPEQQLESKLRRQRLLAVVRALPERAQSCLYLRAEGLKYREIATALGISLGSVAASLAQSLARLGRADGG